MINSCVSQKMAVYCHSITNTWLDVYFISTHIDHVICFYSIPFQLPLNAPQTATLSHVATPAQPPVVTQTLRADARHIVWRRAPVMLALSATGTAASPNPNAGATIVPQGAMCPQERPSGAMTSVISSAPATRPTTRLSASKLDVLMGNYARWSMASEAVFPICLELVWFQATPIS